MLEIIFAKNGMHILGEINMMAVLISLDKIKKLSKIEIVFVFHWLWVFQTFYEEKKTRTLDRHYFPESTGKRRMW